jgi:hypothetical protein
LSESRVPNQEVTSTEFCWNSVGTEPFFLVVDGSGDLPATAGIVTTTIPAATSVSRRGSAATTDRGGQQENTAGMGGGGDLLAPAGIAEPAGRTVTALSQRESAATTNRQLRGGQQKRSPGMGACAELPGPAWIAASAGPTETSVSK